ncbi:phosphoribosyltransferase family protein [Edwardsiella ictaluri]|uniref:phosphoribosyltransferase family protein n=1 Tax=Edwardsiella ictaluri TaxID=67780 RepID=UPI0039F71FA6
MMLLEEIYTNAKVVKSGRMLTTVNEFSDQLPALKPIVLIEIAYQVIKYINISFDKIVTEEDKGAPLATTISLLTGKPLAMARWYPYSLNEYNKNVVKISSEYFDGNIYLNGINKNDRVVIIDDTISTGGTVISLIKAIENAGGIVERVICVVEKSQNNGRINVKEETGHDIISIVKIKIDDNKVTIIDN